ncbi:DNA-binding transcriptional regulator, AcrR family [Parafrankia irregularis]|uniref:DNA-binding transcriptional regulator, AcrR family n=1 Tax=Parafrankia irregularis TaxID=795642 RepID=A0A0S4QK06_9ACTN|nr:MULTISPECIES: TetR/AcrR family transcriptional regulator [Parafrankia]MBE3203967.1 TetR/AcrR family transcriptional regulator [Parafrankia sp. CH37]CUU55160.1 DNA-binding transcriptional regulator, AcrR family [Parafrankia irregularis]
MTERRRGAALEAALLDAAWAELTEHGYANFTMDAVVQRAGTSRPVLYRRWSDRHELVRATIIRALERDEITIPDTGSLRGDILTLMRQFNDTRIQLVTLVSVHLADYYRETGTSPADLRRVLKGDRKDGLDALFARAAQRGEIGPTPLPDRVKSLPFDLLRHEALMTLAPVPEDVLTEIVDTIFLPLAQRASN